MEMNDTPPASLGQDWRKREIGLAFRNALKLGSSLALTWGIALVTRLYVPRFLGPERFGSLNFAEAFTTTAFVFLGLGLDTYVRKEIAVRPDHASDFVGGVVVLRSLLLVLVCAGMEMVMRATRCSTEVKHIVYIYGMGQFFAVGGLTSAGLLHAIGKVNEMSILSVGIKIAWALCLLVAIVLHLGLWAFALTFALTEGAKSIMLFWLARKHVKFRFRIQPKATWLVIVAALPFFVGVLSSTVYDKLGVSLLEFMTNGLEVGWYGAASGFAGMTLLFAPLLSWVIVPLFARSAAASVEDLFRIVRRALEFIWALAVPVSMMMIVGAGVWISILFGQAFAPAIVALRILAVVTLLMYMSIVAAYALAVLNLTWRLNLTFVAGLIVNSVCNMLLIPRMSVALGRGGAGAACATATLITEIAVVAGLLTALGRRAIDRRLIVASAKNLTAGIVVIAVDALLLAPLGTVRLLIDAVAYVALVLVSGGVDARGLVGLVQSASRRRRSKSTDASSASAAAP